MVLAYTNGLQVAGPRGDGACLEDADAGHTRLTEGVAFGEDLHVACTKTMTAAELER